MVNKLRKKFVITAMLSLLVILIIMIAVINIANISQSVRDADNLLQILTTNNGFFPGMLKDNNNQQPPRPDRPLGFEHLNNMRSLEMPYQTRYFWVRFDSSGNILEVDVNHIASVTEDTAKEAATEVYSRGRDKGFYRSFRSCFPGWNMPLAEGPSCLPGCMMGSHHSDPGILPFLLHRIPHSDSSSSWHCSRQS